MADVVRVVETRRSSLGDAIVLRQPAVGRQRPPTVVGLSGRRRSSCARSHHGRSHRSGVSSSAALMLVMVSVDIARPFVEFSRSNRRSCRRPIADARSDGPPSSGIQRRLARNCPGREASQRRQRRACARPTSALVTRCTVAGSEQTHHPSSRGPQASAHRMSPGGREAAPDRRTDRRRVRVAGGRSCRRRKCSEPGSPGTLRRIAKFRDRYVPGAERWPPRAHRAALNEGIPPSGPLTKRKTSA